MMNLSALKNQKWNSVAILFGAVLLLLAIIHSNQRGEDYVHGPVMLLVGMLLIVVFLINTISVMILAKQLIKKDWRNFRVTLKVLVISTLLWIVAFAIDFRITLMDP